MAGRKFEERNQGPHQGFRLLRKPSETPTGVQFQWQVRLRSCSKFLSRDFLIDCIFSELAGLRGRKVIAGDDWSWLESGGESVFLLPVIRGLQRVPDHLRAAIVV